MDKQPHSTDLEDLPVPINPGSTVPKEEATPIVNMAADNLTGEVKQSAIMTHQDVNQQTDGDAFVPASQSPHPVRESPAKSDTEMPDLHESANKQGFHTLNSDESDSQFLTGESTLAKAPEETTDQVKFEPPRGGALIEEASAPVQGKESEPTAREASEASPEANPPRIGFKHDPAEEAIMAHLEPDVDVETKKKKNKKRPKSQRGLNAPTGFEPFYADAPITPAEFEDHKKVYDPALPIIDRIDEGIKRFLFKRRLEPHRRKVFLKYLQYGGVSVGQNHNQGVTPQELKEMDKEEAMQARCTTAIFPRKGTHTPISFNDVATGYLTGYFMGHYNPETQDEIKICTGTMKNFFTYLLYHNVCPEHTEDLEEARKSCDRCEKELWMSHQLVHHDGPGHFNRACSMLFGGYYFDAVDDLDAWGNVRWAGSEVFTRDMARKVIKYAIAINGDDRMTRKFKCLAELDDFPVTLIQDIDGFEIISMEYPSEEARAYYRELAPDLVPVGKIKAKEFRDPSRGPYDLTPSEKIDWDAGLAPAYTFEFFIEAPLLDLMLPRMKFITNVYKTNFGMHYYDEVLNVLPSNYLFLYNDWMMEYKEPKPVDWVGDEAEIARRAENLIVCPPEPTEKVWTLHMLTTEMRWAPSASAWNDCSPKVHAENIIKALERVGYSMQGIREQLGLIEQQKSEKASKAEPVGEEIIEKGSVSKKLAKQQLTEEKPAEEKIVEGLARVSLTHEPRPIQDAEFGQGMQSIDEIISDQQYEKGLKKLF